MTPTSNLAIDHVPERVLVVRLGAVGDVVRTLPALRLMRRAWPSTRFAWAVEEGAAPFLEGHPDLDTLILIERKRISRALSGVSPRALALLRDVRRRLRAFDPGVAFDFQSSFKSGLVAWLSGASVRFGFDAPYDREGSHRFANRRVHLPEPRIHRVERAASLVRAAGVPDAPLVADLALSATERAEGRARLDALVGERRPVILAPFSSRRQAWKRYPLERWAAIARGLGAAGCAPVVIGGPGEADEARELCAAGGPGAVASTDLALRELAALIGAAELLIGGDTGPMHIAWAMGTRVVALYGPTDPVLNAPFGEGHAILAPPERTGRQDPDPFPGIGADAVLGAAERVLPPRLEQGADSP